MSALLELQNVNKDYRIGGFFDSATLRAVKNVSFTLDSSKPEIFTIVGESGSGKTTTARMILGNEAPTSGTLRFMGQDIAAIHSRADRLKFMARAQPIFQNPFEAFNPLTTIDYFLFSTAKRFLGLRDKAAVDAATDKALNHVGLSLAEVRGRYSHELSGGQLQRIAVARALIPEPKLIVADEPVSMVDASLRMSIVNLFRDLRDRLGVSIIYITHDLSTAYYISDRVIIMHRGDVVEAGVAQEVLGNPQHPYSRALSQAVLPPDPEAARKIIMAKIQ
ncbi:ABC transporter ATP-binding protein [Devosia sp. XJ19-1]|uniref:ABC transporter ATP-binding protein n=1 Tax=Devosia ureilytica TaxID=2952754 RepID=A0A9Q4AM20_9HYPH|nr:ABC transporter ATP-binding protein [Devosia ureilytica]MCP8883225.1 ABC transporter ATP-binding protein [Devosia ureilytica]MCP8886407.1 ABC transporter ATP-binding protein [Devosia ureilytica]